MKNRIIFLFISLYISLQASLGMAQNSQSLIKGVEASVQNNLEKVLVFGDWGDGIIEKLNLGYKPNTNDTYILTIDDAIIVPETLAISARVSNENYYIFQTEQSKLIEQMTLIDSVADNNGRVTYRVTVEIKGYQPVAAKLIGIEKGILEIQLQSRRIPGESKSTSSNTVSNVTSEISSQSDRVTFNKDGTPNIIPDEIASSPRKGLSDNNPNAQAVPQTSAVNSGANGANGNQQSGAEGQGEYLSEEIFTNQQNKVPSQNYASGDGSAIGSGVVYQSPQSVITKMDNVERVIGDDYKKNLVYIDESTRSDQNTGTVLRENPALLNVMILSPKSKKQEAEKLSIILNNEKREKIQDRLGLSFRVVNVGFIESTGLKETTLFYRKKYLKSATILADEVDGYQRILKMVNPNRKIGIDVEIILGDK